MNRIFISYRTGDAPFAAMIIDRTLARCFGRDRVFFDNRSIHPGTHFPPRIWNALSSCQALIAVIGPHWFGGPSRGRRLIDRPDDYPRREIAVALRRDVHVIPVLVGAVPRLEACDLPADIVGLASRQFRRLRVRDAEYDLLRLVNELTDLIGGAAHSTNRTLCRGDSSPLTIMNNFHAPIDAPGAVFGPYIEGTKR